MKIFDIATFEKLKINPIKISNLNVVDNFVEYKSKKDLKTFDIVKIKDLLYMYVSKDDFHKHKGNNKFLNNIDNKDISEGLFIRYSFENGPIYPGYFTKNYRQNLTDIANVTYINVTDIWIASNNTTQYLENYFKDDCFFDMLNQELLNTLLKTQNYRHFKIN